MCVCLSEHIVLVQVAMTKLPSTGWLKPPSFSVLEAENEGRRAHLPAVERSLLALS